MFGVRCSCCFKCVLLTKPALLILGGLLSPFCRSLTGICYSSYCLSHLVISILTGIVVAMHMVNRQEGLDGRVTVHCDSSRFCPAGPPKANCLSSLGCVMISHTESDRLSRKQLTACLPVSAEHLRKVVTACQMQPASILFDLCDSSPFSFIIRHWGDRLSPSGCFHSFT